MKRCLTASTARLLSGNAVSGKLSQFKPSLTVDLSFGSDMSFITQRINRAGGLRKSRAVDLFCAILWTISVQSPNLVVLAWFFKRVERLRPAPRAHSLHWEGLGHFVLRHIARSIRELVGRLDLSLYHGEIVAVEGRAGRDHTAPQLLISLWLYAYRRGIRSACELARQWRGNAQLLESYWLEISTVSR
jgi:hypothetical protein